MRCLWTDAQHGSTESPRTFRKQQRLSAHLSGDWLAGAHQLQSTEAAGAGVTRVRLGDLVADQEVRLILAVRVDPPVPLGSGIEVTCRLSDRDQPTGLVLDPPHAIPDQVLSRCRNTGPLSARSRLHSDGHRS